MLTIARLVLLIGVLVILLAAFGVSGGPANLFMLGVGICFAAGLVP